MNHRSFFKPCAYAIFMVGIAFSSVASLKALFLFDMGNVCFNQGAKLSLLEEIKDTFFAIHDTQLNNYTSLITVLNKHQVDPALQDSTSGAYMSHVIVNLLGRVHTGGCVSDQATQDFLKQLVCKGFNFSLVHPKTGNSAFHLAAAAKNPALVTMLLACHPMPVDLRMKNKEAETIIDAFKAGQKIYPLMHINQQCFLQAPPCSAVGAYNSLGSSHYAQHPPNTDPIVNPVEYQQKCEATELFLKKYQQSFATQAALHCMKQQRRYTDLVVMHK